MNDISVKNANLYTDKNKFYLDLRYIVETDNGVYEYHFPKVILPIEYAVLHTDMYSDDISENEVLTLPDDNLILEKGTAYFLEDEYKRVNYSNVYFAAKKIKDKAKDMTIEEIEKKLGYKIRIVDKE